MIRRLIGLIILCAVLHIAPACARPIHGGSNSPASGAAQLGLSDTNGPLIAFADQMKYFGLNTTNGPFGSSASPGLIDADGYPLNGTLASDIIGTISPFVSGTSGVPGNWKISWSGTGGVKFSLFGNTEVLSISNPGCATTQNSTFTQFTGTNCSVTFSFATAHLSVVFAFPAATYSNMSSLVFCRVGNATPDDCARIAGGNQINQDFIAAVAPLNPKTIRPMEWSGANIGSYNYAISRTTNAGNSSLGWLNKRWAGPNLWAGTITGTDTYTSPSFTAAPASWPTFSASSSPIAWQGVFQNTNTVAAPTITISGVSGAKTIVNTNGGALSAGDIKTDSASSLVFDPVLQQVIYAPAGLAATVPIEPQIQMANQLGANLWFCFGLLEDDATITSTVAYARDNLRQGLAFYTEVANEIWNFNLGPPTSLAAAHGAALGFPNTNNERVYGPHGLRTWQVNNLAASAWGARPASQLRRVIANQATSTTSQPQQKWRLEGFDLNSTSYPTYGTFTGGVNHDTYPNRPVDNSDVLSYATYFQGAVLGQFTFGAATGYAAGDLSDCSVAGTNSGGLVCAANNYTLGTPSSLAAAYAWVDNDVRAGTKNGTANSSTLAAFACAGSGFSGSVAANQLTVSFMTYGAVRIGDTVKGVTAGTTIQALGTGAGLTGTYTLNQSATGTPTGTSNGGNLGSCQTSGAPATYVGWEAIAACYDGTQGSPCNNARVSGSNLTVELYEGGWQSTYPTSANCTSMGIDTALGGASQCSTTIQNMLAGYKNSSYGSAIVRDQFNQFMGRDNSQPTFGLLPHSKTPAWYQFQGPIDQGHPWALIQSSIYATPYQNFYSGFQSFR